MIAPNGHMSVLGLMSGTSMDGIDVALLETNGETVDVFGPTGGRPYTAGERTAIAAAVHAARGLQDRSARPDALAEAERAVTNAHAEAVEHFLHENGLTHEDIDVIGFHGQTVIHRPDLGFTVQLGDGSVLAKRLGIDVVHDLRAADMAAGGQGAPIVPVYHKALALAAGLELPLVVVNIGGVGNVTWIGEGDPLAFDTGPGNALLDDWISRKTDQSFDAEGQIALSGKVNGAVLEKLLDDAYFPLTPPKSLDRDAFSLDPVAALSLEDGAATLVDFTASTIAAAEAHFPAPPRRWVVAGGGARNPAIMAALAKRLSAPVTTAAEVGWSVDHLEAQAFAFLAARSLKGLPLTFPTTTGVRSPTTGGVLTRCR